MMNVESSSTPAPASAPSQADPLKAIIQRPLAVVEDCFRAFVERRAPQQEPRSRQQAFAAGKSSWGVPEAFEARLRLNSPNGGLRRIPSLNDTRSELIPHQSLVRFRCMVQDILDPEFYTGIYEEVNESSGAKTLKTAKYKDLVDVPEGSVIQETRNSVTLSRIPLFCVPLPGEAPWLSKALGGGANAEDVAPADVKQREKRKRGSAPRVGTPEKKTPTNQHSGSSKRNRFGAPSEAQTNSMESEASEAPSHEESNPSRGTIGSVKGCMVKLYDQDTSPLKVCDVIEVVGVFCADPLLSSMERDDGFGPFNPPASAAPRVHAISYRRLGANWSIVPAPKAKDVFKRKLQELCASLKGIRQSLLSHISKVLGGDNMAAETLLLSLISRVHYRKVGHAVGKFSLGLRGVPPSLAAQIHALMQDLLPAAKYIEITIDSLNKKAMMPVKDYNTNHLSQGELQAGKGTHMLLDETRLGEGKLSAKGVKNFKAVQQVLSEQKLNYDFQFHNITFDADTPMLVLSKGKSIFKCDCTIELKIKNEPPTDYKALRVDPKILRTWREYLLVARQLEVDISPDMSKVIQNDIIAMRKANPQLDQSKMHMRLGLSRLAAITFLEPVLTKERWGYTVPLYKYIA